MAKDNSSTNSLPFGISARSSHKSPPKQRKSCAAQPLLLTFSLKAAEEGESSSEGLYHSGKTSFQSLIREGLTNNHLQSAATSWRRRAKGEAAKGSRRKDLIWTVSSGPHQRCLCLSPREHRNGGKKRHIELTVVHQIQPEAPRANLIRRDARASPVHAKRRLPPAARRRAEEAQDAEKLVAGALRPTLRRHAGTLHKGKHQQLLLVDLDYCCTLGRDPHPITPPAVAGEDGERGLAT